MQGRGRVIQDTNGTIGYPVGSSTVTTQKRTKPRYSQTCHPRDAPPPRLSIPSGTFGGATWKPGRATPFTPLISGDIRVVKSGDTCEESGFATITSPTLCGLVYDMAIKDKLFLEGLDERHLDGKFELPDKNFQGCNRITHRTFIWWRYFR